ncbi:WD repeat-containing protein [Lentinula edodes]|uniref:WD repeat-containing protein n=1 Tax=Lentinula edodes TaxID=5353 RepID=A0A1Q3EAW2_LENED|nr:WD repeat-containing protein [Lentinula edodes]
MPVQSEKRVLWHPRHSNKFVVGGGSQITLYELSDEQPEIRQCFAWSPASIPSDIFAVGHTSGRVDLLRLEASRYSQLGRDENVLSSGPILSLPVRNQRSCNALAFCPSDPNYLAVGLDKVRGDSSLVIWDVQEEMGVFRTTMNPFDNSNVVTIPHSKELIGKFSTYPPIPRTDHPVRTDQRIVQAHAQTELISSLAWLPQNTHPYLLLAGLSPRWLRLFDIRNPAGSGAGASYVSSIATKVTGIATDPFDTTRFATWGDGVVTVWDLRKLHISRIHSDSTNATPSPTPLLTFSEKDAGLDGVSSTLALGASKPSVASSSTSSKTRGVSATDFPNLPVVQHSTYMTAEFSPSRRGVLVTLAKDANYVRLWDVLELQDKVPVGRKSWANLPWGSSGTSTESKNPSPIHEEEHREQSQHPMLILYNTRKAFTRSIPNPLCSFAAVPPVYLSHKTISKIVVVSQLGEITVQSVHDAPQALAWSSRGDMLYGPLQSVDKDDVKIGFGVVHSYHEEQEETVKDEYIHDSQTSPSVTRPSTNQKPFPASEPNELHERGRPRNPITFREVPPSPALFGRGDAEGFPALSRPIIENPVSANLAATKPTDGRKEEEKKMTFSPAAALRVPLRPTNALLSPLNVSAIPYNEPSTPIKSQSSNPPTPKYQSMVNGGKASVVHAAANDISVLMRRRAIRGYSIRDPLRNASVIRELSRSGNPGAGVEFEEPSVFRSKESEMLADLWEWIHHSQKFLSSPTPLVQGYDFSFAEPLTNDPEWRQALLQLLARTEEAPSASRLPNFPYVSTSRPLQRHVCLHLIGWGFILRDDSLMAEVRRWEREGEGDEGYARAAAWLVFSGRYGGGAGVSNEGAVHGEGAIECLLRSEDESHHMMSGVIAALVPFASATLTTPNSSSKLALPSTLLEHYARLVNKLQDSYLRALLTHLTAISSSVTPSGEHWLEILHDEEDLLPFYERLALAFCFLDDTALTTYLRRCREHALGKNGGDVDALIVTGLGTSEGREVVKMLIYDVVS